MLFWHPLELLEREDGAQRHDRSQLATMIVERVLEVPVEHGVENGERRGVPRPSQARPIAVVFDR
jgi:hypothetical protein